MKFRVVGLIGRKDHELRLPPPALPGRRPVRYDAAGRHAAHREPVQPVGDVRVSSGFGGREHPVHGGKRMRHGVGPAAPVGTPVRAATAGTVTPTDTRQPNAHVSRYADGVAPGMQV